MLHAVLLSLLVADAVAMSTVHMMWRNEGSILAEGLEYVAARLGISECGRALS